jgi:hypothetical protein
MHHQEMPICDVVASYSIPRPVAGLALGPDYSKGTLKGTERLMKRGRRVTYVYGNVEAMPIQQLGLSGFARRLCGVI